MKLKIITIILISFVFLQKSKAQKVLTTNVGHVSSINSIALSPDGKFIISGSSDNTIKLWDIKTGREIRTYKGHKNYVNSVAFSPDGKNIISGSKDRSVKLWNTLTGEEIKTIETPNNVINNVVYSPDGKYIISDPGTIQLSDITTGQKIRRFDGRK